MMLETKISMKNLHLAYGHKSVLQDVNLNFYQNHVTALIGPSGCGKSSLLRCLNRMNDSIHNIKIRGQIYIDGINIYDPSSDVVKLRKKVGMIFQKPNPFFKSVYENVAYGPRIHRMAKNKEELDNIIEQSLKRAGLFNEVKDNLHQPAHILSGGQQQRLCIARAIAINPEIILMDEPCSALDPIATAWIEELIDELRLNFTIILVTHSMKQAARVSQYTAFIEQGMIIEHNATEQLFTMPLHEKTQNYITGCYTLEK